MNENAEELVTSFYLEEEMDKGQAKVEYYLQSSSKVYPGYALKIQKKTKKKGGNVVCEEEYTSKYIELCREEIEEIIGVLARNTVTPTTANDILEDLGII